MADLPGTARLELVDGVVHMDPAPALLEAMLRGWIRQQRARFLKDDATIKPRVTLVRRFVGFSGQYPWEWTAGEAEAFIGHLRSGERPVVFSTARAYENTLKLFSDFVADPRYGWPAECEQRFGRSPQQIFHEWNTLTHRSEYEGRPGRRPLTYDEVQLLFDTADGRVEEIRSRGRKGALTAMRDAALLKTIYAYGLRRGEACGLDLADMRHNPKARDFGPFGGLFVRSGKSSRGGPPKRRTVLTVPEMDWVVSALQQWVQEIRPRFSPGSHAALWVTERRGRINPRKVDTVFAVVRQAAGLSEELDLHCVRHSYVTHLIEFDYPERFVQDQVGHAFAATTAIYTGVSDEYRNRLLQRALQNRGSDLWRPA
jgi:integrase/recombinase XerD